MTDTDLREKVARIVDPAVWKNRGAFIRTGHDFDRHASPSLVKADAILALISSERGEALERAWKAEGRCVVLRRLLERLCLAADEYGVRYLDSDDMTPEAEELSEATQAARAALSQGEEG